MHPEIIGVIAIGGNSSRLTDKSNIKYHGIPHRNYLYELLKGITSEVYFSCNKFQSESIEEEYKIIVDTDFYTGHGPISGLLSAFENHPDRSVLFIGCDYVNINEDSIMELLRNRNGKNAVAYFNDENYYEPLLALYENSTYSHMKKYFEEGNYSLNKFLININAIKIKPRTKNILLNINTVDQYQSFISKDKII